LNLCGSSMLRALAVVAVVTGVEGLAFSRRDIIARGLAATAGVPLVASSATDAELKSFLVDTQKEIESGPPKKKKKAPEAKSESGGGLKLPDLGSISTDAQAAGRARAEARRASLAAPVSTSSKESSEGGAGVYVELRAKRQAQKEAAAERMAAKKKNMTPIEEFKGR